MVENQQEEIILLPFAPSVRVNAGMTLVILISLKKMETNGVALEWGCNPFWTGSIDFNESCIGGVIAALTLQ